MQATFAFSLDLADDTDHAKKLMDAILNAFITVKAAAKEIGAAFNSPPVPITNASPVPASASVPSIAAAAPATKDAKADMMEFFDEVKADEAAAAPAVERKPRGRKPKVDAFAPANAANEPLTTEPVAEEVNQFEQPIESLQELIELGNSVCKNCGPKLVGDALKKFNAGKYSQIPQDKWVEVASMWRRALNASVKA